MTRLFLIQIQAMEVEEVGCMEEVTTTGMDSENEIVSEGAIVENNEEKDEDLSEVENIFVDGVRHRLHASVPQVSHSS